MSKMIPRETIDCLRKQNDVSVDIYGIPCDLYIPSNLDTVDDDDAYGADSQYTYDHYITVVWVEFSPSQKRLRKLGVFSEDVIPMIARFKETAVNDSSATVSVNVIIGSYIKLSIEYIPSNESNVDEFEIADVLIGKTHDAIISKLFKLVPRRVKVAGS